MLTPECYFEPAAKTLIALANGDAACSRYDFTENSSVPLRKSPMRGRGSFAEAYRSDLKGMRRIGVVSNHLNIQDLRLYSRLRNSSLGVSQSRL
jgi:hypothetical protein